MLSGADPNKAVYVVSSHIFTELERQSRSLGYLAGASRVNHRAGPQTGVEDFLP
jgi:hypothetical protein